MAAVFTTRSFFDYWEPRHYQIDRRPADQVAFENQRCRFLKDYEAAKSKAEKTKIFYEAGEWTGEYAKAAKWKINNWRGKALLPMLQTANGNMYLVIYSEYLCAGIHYSTELPPGDPIHKALSGLGEWDDVVFTGRFKPSIYVPVTGFARVAEAYRSDRDRLARPEFLIELERIARASD